MNFEKFGVPFKEGGKYYYFKNDGLQNQSVLYVADDASSEEKFYWTQTPCQKMEPLL